MLPKKRGAVIAVVLFLVLMLSFSLMISAQEGEDEHHELSTTYVYSEDGRVAVTGAVSTTPNQQGEIYISQSEYELISGEAVKGYIVELEDKPVIELKHEEEQDISEKEEQGERLEQEAEDIEIKGIGDAYKYPVKVYKSAQADALKRQAEDQEEELGEKLKDHKKKLSADQERVRRVIERETGEDSEDIITGEFTSLMNAIVVNVSENEAKALESHPDVKAVYPDRSVQGILDDSVPLVNTDLVWGMTDGQGLPVKGQGMTIAVIDSGVDYTHEDLGGCFGSELSGTETGVDLEEVSEVSQSMITGFAVERSFVLTEPGEPIDVKGSDHVDNLDDENLDNKVVTMVDPVSNVGVIVVDPNAEPESETPANVVDIATATNSITLVRTATLPNSYRILANSQTPDLDNDGRNELFLDKEMLPLNTHTIQVYEADSDNNYEEVGELEVPCRWNNEYNVCYKCMMSDVGDTDDDGLFEMLYQCPGYHYLYESDSPSRYPEVKIWENTGGGVHPGIVDLDSDGKKEIITSRGSDDGFHYYYIYERGAEDFSKVFELSFLTADKFEHDLIQALRPIDDADGDGKKEFIIAGVSDFYIYENTGDNQYQEVWHTRVNSSNRSVNLGRVRFLGDTDQDGKKEIVMGGLRVGQDIADPYLDAFFVYEATGDNNYELIWEIIHPTSLLGSDHMEVGDVDGDSINELIIVSDDSDVYVYKSSGDNQFELATNFVWDTPYDVSVYSEFALSDIDSDGLDEAIFNKYENGQVNRFVYEADIGTGSCGDGICSPSESCVSCLSDCGSTPESCDGVDNDCDGQVDENLHNYCGLTLVGECEYGLTTCNNGISATLVNELLFDS